MKKFGDRKRAVLDGTSARLCPSSPKQSWVFWSHAQAIFHSTVLSAMSSAVLCSPVLNGCLGASSPGPEQAWPFTHVQHAQPQLWAANLRSPVSRSQARRPAKRLAPICLSRSRRRPVSSPTASFVTIPESDVRRDSALAARKICSQSEKVNAVLCARTIRYGFCAPALLLAIKHARTGIDPLSVSQILFIRPACLTTTSKFEKHFFQKQTKSRAFSNSTRGRRLAALQCRTPE
jgi:hypothetical protein